MDRRIKNQCIRGGTIPVTPPTARLPAEMWALVLHFVPFDDVLSLTASSNYLHTEMPSQLKHRFINCGESFYVRSSAVEEFSSVENVYVYSFVLECPCCGEHITLDDEAGQNIVPFISSLPNISSCYIGGLSKVNPKLSDDNIMHEHFDF